VILCSNVAIEDCFFQSAMTNSLCNAQTEACAIFWLALKKQCLLRIYFHANHCLFGQSLNFYNSTAKALLLCNTILPDFLLIFVLYACHILQYCADASIFHPIYLYSYSPHPLYIGMLFPTVFCCCFYDYFT